MPKGIKKCKVCGKEYEYCKSMITDPKMFRWQDVACCQEHGAIYLAQVMEARKKVATAETTKLATDGAESAPTKKRSRKKKADADEVVSDKEMA